MKGFTDFLFEKENNGENISYKAQTSNQEHQDSLHEEREHLLPAVIHLLVHTTRDEIHTFSR